MWTREAISANTERRCRRWVMRHNQPWKVLLTSELLTSELSGRTPAPVRCSVMVGFEMGGQSSESKASPTARAKSLTSFSLPLNTPPRSNFRDAVIAANLPTSSSLVVLSL